MPESQIKRLDLLCHCTVCDCEFSYGDEVSPMFDDSLWDFLIRYYGLEVHLATALFIQSHSCPPTYDRIGHTYICAKCAESALDRPLRITDLNGSHFNMPFLISYFGYTPEQASYFVQ